MASVPSHDRHGLKCGRRVEIRQGHGNFPEERMPVGGWIRFPAVECEQGPVILVEPEKDDVTLGGARIEGSPSQASGCIDGNRAAVDNHQQSAFLVASGLGQKRCIPPTLRRSVEREGVQGKDRSGGGFDHTCERRSGGGPGRAGRGREPGEAGRAGGL